MKFNFTSQICTTKEQSERLLALGLKKETADMCWVLRDIDRGGNEYSVKYMSIGQGAYSLLHPDWYTPAWSLHRLIEMMPTEITHDDCSLLLGANAACIYYADGEYAEAFKTFEGNLYDCVVKCIEWLIREGYFNKEYLEE